jgi:TonB family protein
MTELTLHLLEFWHALLLHLWQSTLVMVPLLLLARGLRNAPARLTDAFWHLGLLKLFLPLSLCSGLAREVAGYVSTLLSPATADTGLAAVAAVQVVLDPGRGLDLGRLLPGNLVAVIAAALTVTWQLGVLWNASLLARDLARARRHRGTPLLETTGPARERLERILSARRIPAARVLVTGSNQMPYVVGFLRPRIVVPQRLLSALPDPELTAILLHEDAHRRRRDPLRTLLQRIGLALFWFFPLAHMILARLRESAEFACDEHAMSAGIDPRRFTLAVARTVRLTLAPEPLAVAAGSGGRSLLQKRLSRLHPYGRSAMSRYRLIIAAAAVLVLAGSFLPLPLLADADPPPPPPKAAKSETPPPPPKAVKDEIPPPPPKTVKGDTPPPPKAAASGKERLIQSEPQKGEKEKKAADDEKKRKEKQSKESLAGKEPKQAKGEKEQKEKLREGEHEVQMPKILKMAKVVYPEEALQAGIEGTVFVVAVIDPEGKCIETWIKEGIEGHEELDEAAAVAVEKSAFAPATIDGKPAKGKLVVPVKFASH